MSNDSYFTASQAAALLNISVDTLYAYVSRGLIRSEEGPGGKRTRRYHAGDVQGLKERKEQRRQPERVAERALHWGAPILESAITLIENGRLFYRGHDALRLATTESVERVASLIWLGDGAAAHQLFNTPPSISLSPNIEHVRQASAHLLPVEQLQAVLPLLASDDLAAYDWRPTAVAATGARIMRLTTALIGGAVAEHRGIVDGLHQCWTAHLSQAPQLLNAALILCADHELNVSAFTARCVASAGATPYAVVGAALAAAQGVQHGGQTARVEALLRDVDSAADVRATLAQWLKRGETIPGFGHALYPAGDPRARLLLDLLGAHLGGTPAIDLSTVVIDAMRAVHGAHPTIDFALVTLARALALPVDSALTLFVLGRQIGWIGHAIEQYQLNQPIRPRARYVGEHPRRSSNE